MKLTAFKIRNFRSIIDSGWVPFSSDGITVLVGQNESGKSSVLEALYLTLSGENPTEDDFRIGSDLPAVQLRVHLTADDVDSQIKAVKGPSSIALKNYLSAADNKLELNCCWEREIVDGKKSIVNSIEIQDDRLEEFEVAARKESKELPSTSSDPQPPEGVSIDASNPQPAADTSSAAVPVPQPQADHPDIAVEVWRALPLGVLFNEESGSLPSQVDINDKGQPTGNGARAALNFLKIADVKLPDLLKGDRRARENTLNRANSKVSNDFNAFWSQTIGKSGRLSLKCDIDHFGAEQPDKAGKPHLVFWICDGNTQLYPKQRSQGVRWFVSFYLQLKASEKAKDHRVFLLDEPGANLHSKAQGDVLKLINQLGKDTSTVIYSTHSPQMLEYSKLFRVHAVQRDGELDDSPTRIIDAHRLGTASTDTLSPVLTAMGVDLSQHQVVRKSNNVILEEMSGYYYLNSFWKLFSITTEVHFIAATGVNKVEALANMFRGWGLNYIVAVDDDKQGREAYNAMKRELFGDDATVASRNMVKIPGCVGIEDAFSTEDFAKLVLEDESLVITVANSEYVKSTSRSKPVLGYRFAIAVENKKITLESLSDDSKNKIRLILSAIEERLN